MLERWCQINIFFFLPCKRRGWGSDWCRCTRCRSCSFCCTSTEQGRCRSQEG